MCIAKKKSSGRSAKHGAAPAGEVTLGMGLVTKAGAVMPKRAASFTSRAPSDTNEVFAGKPAKVEPLLTGYHEAAARSRAAGRAVSFLVEVYPSGRTLVTQVEDGAGGAAASLNETAHSPDAELQAALEEARRRGTARAAEIMAGEDMLSADQFAALLGTTRMTVNTKRRNGHVLGLDGAKRGFRFPVWQVDKDGKPFAALPALFERLGGGPWTVYRFLVQAHPELDGLTGREALRRGKVEQALEAAESIAQGTFA